MKDLSELTEINDKAFLDFSKFSGDDFKKLSKQIGRSVKDIDGLLKYIKKDYTSKRGKVGFIAKNEEGLLQYVVRDDRYLLEASYRKAVNRSGYRPVFLRGLLKKKGVTVSLTREIKRLRRKLPSLNKALDNLTAYKRALIHLKKGLQINTKAIISSITRLKEEGAKKGRINSSIDEGIRQAILDQREAKLKGKICRMTATSAEQPDDFHATLEWQELPCEEVVEHLKRFGCQHEFEVLD